MSRTYQRNRVNRSARTDIRVTNRVTISIGSSGPQILMQETASLVYARRSITRAFDAKRRTLFRTCTRRFACANFRYFRAQLIRFSSLSQSGTKLNAFRLLTSNSIARKWNCFPVLLQRRVCCSEIIVAANSRIFVEMNLNFCIWRSRASCAF